MTTILKTYKCLKERATVSSSIVLRDLGESNTCRYVTHMRDDDYFHANGGGGYFWGHYHDDLDKAEHDFAERCVKYPGGTLS